MPVCITFPLFLNACAEAQFCVFCSLDLFNLRSALNWFEFSTAFSSRSLAFDGLMPVCWVATLLGCWVAGCQLPVASCKFAGLPPQKASKSPPVACGRFISVKLANHTAVAWIVLLYTFIFLQISPNIHICNLCGRVSAWLHLSAHMCLALVFLYVISLQIIFLIPQHGSNSICGFSSNFP